MKTWVPHSLAGAVLAAAASLVGLSTAGAQSSAEIGLRGTEVFKTRCATCHDRQVGPATEALRRMTPEAVFQALTTGAMRPQAQGLSEADIQAVVFHVTGRPPSLGVEATANHCKQPPAPLVLDDRGWNGWSGQRADNARFHRNPGLKAADVPRLKLKWAFAYPGGPAAQPVVIGRRLFVSSGSGKVFALDAASGCTHWVVDLGSPSNPVMSIGRLPSGKFAAFLGDNQGSVRALDADSGAELWKVKVDEHPTVRLNGGVVLFEGRLYVPVSAVETQASTQATYPCCSFQGSVVALDAATGRQIWKTYTMAQRPTPVPGQPGRLAPAGAAVWTAPTIDPKRRMLYVGTGQGYTYPAAPETDAVVAFDLDTGARRWVRQLNADDAWTVGCEPKPHPNCPKVLGPDFDVGAPILASMPNGRDMIVASSKSGVAWGLDPEQQGKVVWETRVGQGGTRGGIEWGGATDGRLVYFPVSDARVGAIPSTPSHVRPVTRPGGMHALEVATGRRVWQTAAPPSTCAWGTPCEVSQPAAPALIPGVVFAGSWDGHERAYDTRTGKIIWEYDTGRTVDGVNGTKVTGGSIDRGAQSVANGVLYVNSGVRMRTGNALLAFSVEGK